MGSPITAWSEQDLRDYLIYPKETGHDGCDDRYEILQELLKRERAKVADAASFYVCDCTGFCGCHHTALNIANRIRNGTPK